MRGMKVAVVWTEDGGEEFAGTIAVDEDCAILAGASREGHESGRRLALSELAAFGLGRLEWMPASRERGLVLVSGGGGRIEVASLEGAGVLHELAEELARGVETQTPVTDRAGARSELEVAV